MFIIKYRKIFYLFSATLITLSILAVTFWGIKFGIDFVGGSILEVSFPDGRPNKTMIEEQIKNLNLEKDFSIRNTGENGIIVRSTTITDEQKVQIIGALNNIQKADEVRFNTVGPTLGSELRGRAFLAIFIVVLSIMLYVAYVFRKVSKPASSWKYGLTTIICFIHDVSVPIGFFAFLGHFYGVEVDTLFVIAILVVLGYSINDTIVVFDRIRDNLKEIPDNQKLENFEQVTGKSLMQVFGRSLNTSLTTLISLFALFIWGGESTKWFSLALIVGVAVGAYSSIFFAAPMLVTFSKFVKK